MQLRLLGALDVYNGNGRVSVPSGKPRSLLVLLALHPNEPVSADRIVDALWGETPPASATAIVQTYVSRLRKILGDGCIETVGHGYRLVLTAGSRDVDLVEQLRKRSEAETPTQASRSLREALGLFRGQPLADVAHEEFAQAELRRLEELRAALVVERVEADVEAGRHSEVLSELEGLVAARPLDERLRGLLILALYRSGRQADALAAYQDARRTLKEDLGLEPSEGLRDLQRKILAHDPSLAGPTDARTPHLPDARTTPRRRAAGVAIGVGAVALLGAALVAGALALSKRGPGAVPVPANSVAVIDPTSLEVIASVPVGRRPSLVAATPGVVWVASVGDRVLTRIDSRTFEVLGTVGLGFEPSAIEPVGDALWVAGGHDHALWRVDRDGLPRVKLTFRERYPLPEGFERGPAGLASSKHGLWLSHGQEVTLLDPSTGQARRDVKVGGPWTAAIEIAGTHALVASERGVETFDPKTLEVGAPVTPFFDPVLPPGTRDGVAAERGVAEIRSVLAPSALSCCREHLIVIAWRRGQLWGVMERRLELLGTLDVGAQLVGLTFLDGAVWTVGQHGDDHLTDGRPQPIVTRVDLGTGDVDGTIDLPHTLVDVTAANGLLWVAVGEP
jgi:YVTN family beta-propeller protein